MVTDHVPATRHPVRLSRRVARLLAVLWLATVAGESPAAIRVDFDVSVYFGRFKTFNWMTGTPAKDPEAESAIHLAVGRQLSDRGLKWTDSEPDLLIVTHATLGGTWALDPDNFAYGGYPQAGWGSKKPKPAEAVLLIDILEAESTRIIWRGMVVDSMPRDPEKVGRKIDKLVRKLFRKFPPR